MSEKRKQMDITSAELLAVLKSWEDIAHDDNRIFINHFCPDAWMLTSVSWDCENIRIVYILNSGQHISNSFKIEEWLDFLKTNATHIASFVGDLEGE